MHWTIPGPAIVLAAFTAMAATASAQGLQVASQHYGLLITKASELPENPDGRPDNPVCTSRSEEAQSLAAKTVEDAGWAVSGEVAQDDITYISFVGKVTQGTSGSCLMEQGNVAIFRGDQLMALVYAAEDASRGIGSILPKEPDGVRIWDGDYLSMPLADLRVHSGELVLVRPIADRDYFCGGEFSAPNIYGLPIHQARILLLAEEWAPSPPDQPSSSGWVQDMAENGLPEVQDCSGTGFGYCAYKYSREGGLTLHLTTAGEGEETSSPMVVGYGIECE